MWARRSLDPKQSPYMEASLHKKDPKVRIRQLVDLDRSLWLIWPPSSIIACNHEVMTEIMLNTPPKSLSLQPENSITGSCLPSWLKRGLFAGHRSDSQLWIGKWLQAYKLAIASARISTDTTVLSCMIPYGKLPALSLCGKAHVRPRVV